MMVYIDSEIARISRRLAKCDRRISAGYKPPAGKETEEHRKERLLKRLRELENEKKLK
jgi:hypothetical protein